MIEKTASRADSLLRDWNRREETAAAQLILPCNGSHAWAMRMAQARPFASVEDLSRGADTLWLALDEKDWEQAFQSHPRLGETAAAGASAQSLQWSHSEQNQLTTDAYLQQALAVANRVYEERFGRIFLLCATGKRVGEVLATLKSRLGNDARTEIRVVAEEQRRITQLRLRKWLHLPAAACGDV